MRMLSFAISPSSQTSNFNHFINRAARLFQTADVWCVPLCAPCASFVLCAQNLMTRQCKDTPINRSWGDGGGGGVPGGSAHIWYECVRSCMNYAIICAGFMKYVWKTYLRCAWHDFAKYIPYASRCIPLDISCGLGVFMLVRSQRGSRVFIRDLLC